MKNIRNFEARVDVPIHTKYKYHEIGSNVTKTKKEKEYDYMICDYCGEEIRIEKDITKRTGGITEIPLNNYKRIRLGLCTKCLKPVLEIVRKEYGLEI